MGSAEIWKTWCAQGCLILLTTGFLACAMFL